MAKTKKPKRDLSKFTKKATSTPPNVLRALGHEIRQAIVGLLVEQKEASPNETSKILGVNLSTTSYHFKVLFKDCGVIERTKQEQRRGALENYYKLTKEMRQYVGKKGS